MKQKPIELKEEIDKSLRDFIPFSVVNWTGWENISSDIENLNNIIGHLHLTDIYRTLNLTTENKYSSAHGTFTKTNYMLAVNQNNLKEFKGYKVHSPTITEPN